MRKRLIVAAVVLGIYLVSGAWRGFFTGFETQAGATTAFMLGVGGAIGWHWLGPRGPGAIRRGALLSTLAVAALVGNCSANGVVTDHGTGADFIVRQPLVYLVTVFALTGPMLLILLAPAFLALRPRAAALASLCATVAGLATFLVAMVLAFSGVLCARNPSALQDATCAADTGSLGAAFGAIAGPAAVLPFALLALNRRRSSSIDA